MRRFSILLNYRNTEARKLLRKSHDVGGVVTSFKKDLIPLLSANHDVAVRADGECGTGSNITPR